MSSPVTTGMAAGAVAIGRSPRGQRHVDLHELFDR
jgi:hypothetical protein